MSGHRGNKHSTRGLSASLTGSKVVSMELNRLRQNEVAYKSRIRAFEVEVETLRCRLDSLRKAKNTTTIIRKDREESKLSPSSSSGHSRMLNQQDSVSRTQEDCVTEKVKRLQSQVDQLNAKLLSENIKYEEATSVHQKELVNITERHGDEMTKLEAQLEQVKQEKVTESWKDYEYLQSEIKRLSVENHDLSNQLAKVLASNEALRKGSLLLQEKSEALLEELSIKEIEWTEREDRLKAEIREQWGERYHGWITKAEKKMEELQQINTLLQSMLKTKKDNDL